MSDRASEQLLSSFADHLLRNQLADERHCRFMIHWVRRYLVHPPPVSNATPDEQVDAYLGQLRKENLKEWQLDQARQTITAWRAWSGGRNMGEPAPAPRVVAAADGSVDPGKTLAVLEHTLRLRHYPSAASSESRTSTSVRTSSMCGRARGSRTARPCCRIG